MVYEQPYIGRLGEKMISGDRLHTSLIYFFMIFFRPKTKTQYLICSFIVSLVSNNVIIYVVLGVEMFLRLVRQLWDGLKKYFLTLWE